MSSAKPHIKMLEETYNPFILSKDELEDSLAEAKEVLSEILQRRKEITEVLHSQLKKKSFRKAAHLVRDAEQRLSKLDAKIKDAERNLERANTITDISAAEIQQKEDIYKGILIKLGFKEGLTIIKSIRSISPSGLSSFLGNAYELKVQSEDECDEDVYVLTIFEDEKLDLLNAQKAWVNAKSLPLKKDAAMKATAEKLISLGNERAAIEESIKDQRTLLNRIDEKEKMELELIEISCWMKKIKANIKIAINRVAAIGEEKRKARKAKKSYEDVKARSETKRIKKRSKKGKVSFSQLSISEDEKAALSSLDSSSRKVLLKYWKGCLSFKPLRKEVLQFAEAMSYRKLQALLELNLSNEVWQIVIQQTFITWRKIEIIQRNSSDAKALRTALQPEPEQQSVEVTHFANLRILYVAGGSDFLNRKTITTLEEAGAEVKGVSCDRAGVPVDGYDYVLLHTRVSSHSANERYKKSCEKGKLILLSGRIRPSTVVKYLQEKIESRTNGDSSNEDSSER